jgi:uncharacterized membrane protein
VWWSPDRLYRSPDRLRQPRGGYVTPDMHRHPGITSRHTTVDMIRANRVPRGHSHVCRSGADGLEVANTPRLRTVLDR